MSEPWIKWRTNLREDPRVISMAMKHKGEMPLELALSAVCGALAWLWSEADKHTTNGRLEYLAEYCDKQVGIPGFCESLTKLTRNGSPRPWLEIGDGWVRVLLFNEHNSATAKKRAQGAKRAAKFRHKPAHNSNAQSVTGSVTKRAPRAEPEAEKKRENTLAGSEPVACAENGGGNSQGALPACLPQNSPREALRFIGVGEPALTRLAEHHAITPPIIAAAWADAQRGSRDPIRVLVAGLCKAHGIELPRRSGTLKNAILADPGLANLIQKREQAKRNQRGNVA